MRFAPSASPPIIQRAKFLPVLQTIVSQYISHRPLRNALPCQGFHIGHDLRLCLPRPMPCDDDLVALLTPFLSNGLHSLVQHTPTLVVAPILLPGRNQRRQFALFCRRDPQPLHQRRRAKAVELSTGLLPLGPTVERSQRPVAPFRPPTKVRVNPTRQRLRLPVQVASRKLAALQSAVAA